MKVRMNMILHPMYRGTKYAISDTSTIGLFCFGFDRAIACWKSGCTVESISHTASSSSPKDRGVIAACDAIMGWLDCAEREMRAHGATREEASRFVSERMLSL